MSTPATSVALATYNGARFLPAQLASIAAQTHRPDEIVVGDDGSHDETEEVLVRFERDSGIPVRFTRNPERLGSSANFAAVITRCRGDVVFLCDQDDLWKPNKVATCLAKLVQRPDAAYVFSNAGLIAEDGAKLRGALWDRVFFDRRQQAAFAAGGAVSILLRTNTVTGATMAARREALTAALPVPPGWVHDAWFAFVLALDRAALPINERLMDYRVHASQQIGVIGWSPAALLGLVRRQDAEFYRREAANFHALAEYLETGTAHPANHGAALQGAYSKAAFLERRAAGRKALSTCVGGVLRALAAGDYRRYGMGAKQAVFDLAGGIDAAFRRCSAR